MRLVIGAELWGLFTLLPKKSSTDPPSLPSLARASIQLEGLEITSSLGAALHHLPHLPSHSLGANVIPLSHLPRPNQGLIATGIDSSLENHCHVRMGLAPGWHQGLRLYLTLSLHHGSRHPCRKFED